MFFSKRILKISDVLRIDFYLIKENSVQWLSVAEKLDGLIDKLDGLIDKLDGLIDKLDGLIDKLSLR